jgi:hypothetical protein
VIKLIIYLGNNMKQLWETATLKRGLGIAAADCLLLALK